MYKKYGVRLSDAERSELRARIRSGHRSARVLVRARVLLGADEGCTDDQIAACVHAGTTTIERLRRRHVEQGLAAALHDRPRPGAQPKLDGKQEALLVALSCS